MIQLKYIFVHHSISTLYYIYIFNMFSIQIEYGSHLIIQYSRMLKMFIYLRIICLKSSVLITAISLLFAGMSSKVIVDNFFLCRTVQPHYALCYIFPQLFFISLSFRAHNSQPFSLKQWIEAIISRLHGQFLKTSMIIAISSILVMISNNFLHGFYRVILQNL